MTIEMLRQFRVLDFALFDFAAAYLGVWLLSPLLIRGAKQLRLKISLASWLWLTLPIGVLAHLLFNQSTPLMKSLFDPAGHYLLKLGLVLMILMGVKDIRKIPK